MKVELVVVNNIYSDILLRFYTLSDIINATIKAGFHFKMLDEHPSWDNEKIPGNLRLLQRNNGIQFYYFQKRINEKTLGN